MRLSLLGFALICSAALMGGNALGQAADKAPRPKVGYIYVVGNEVTRFDVILKQLPPGLAPGSALNNADLELAERNLTKTGFFEVNAETGEHPTVEVLNRYGDEEWKDLLVRVKETRTSSLRRMVGFSTKGELVASIVFEERNFDPTRFPTGWDDFVTDRAFRGAGLTLRLELIQIPLLPIGTPRFLQMGGFLLPLDKRPDEHASAKRR